ncbi:hypothetical protein PLIIFM63780_004667 [Purpureocillium lilacinum]|nr:hypothetical protein PLIIFM63780_004667 [Purpureocillium lilacinum]
MEGHASSSDIISALRDIRRGQSQLAAAIESLSERLESGDPAASAPPGPVASDAKFSGASSIAQAPDATGVEGQSSLTDNSPDGVAEDSPVVKAAPPRSGFTSRIILTTYPKQIGIDPLPMDWGNPDPMKRGPVAVARSPSTIRRRNGLHPSNISHWSPVRTLTYEAMGSRADSLRASSGGSYSIYYALAVASKELDVDHRVPDGKVCLNKLGELAVTKFAVEPCNGSDVFGSDICTCRPYLIFGIEEAVKEAQDGGSGVVIYFRKEGRALGEVTKATVPYDRPRIVYNARKRGADRASDYFTRTENIAGVKDMRFQALMPDILHWLGIQKIDRMLSMSNMKHDAIVGQGIPIHERVELPDELIPADSRVEIDAKITAGYFTAGKRLTAEELQSVQGRMWEE